MKITKVDVKPVEQYPGSNLKAYCSVTLDDVFVVRDIKIIGLHDRNIVAMPNRKLVDHCFTAGCHTRNVLSARWCNGCGARLEDYRAQRNVDGSWQLYVDVAHPILPEFRIAINDAVLSAYQYALSTKEQADKDVELLSKVQSVEK